MVAVPAAVDARTLPGQSAAATPRARPCTLALAEPIATVRRLRRSWPAARELFAEGRAPRTSINRRIGSDRRLALIRGSLDVAANIAHAHGATVNDVLMTAVAAGYADLFRSRGEPIDGVVLRAFVPVSLHQEQPGQARGNIDAGMLVPLPIGERDDIRRLEKIAAEAAERKKKCRPPRGACSGPCSCSVRSCGSCPVSGS